MSVPTVLLPGGGGAAAVGAMKSLRMGGFRGKIVSTDANPLSAGLYLADAHAVLPPIRDPQFFERAVEVIEREGVSVILPTSGFDILVYSERKAELEGRGVRVAMSDPEVVQSCVDKWQFYQLTRDRFPLPRTTLEPDDRVTFPCFVKPVRGKGSRRIAVCRDPGELAHQLASHADLLIQEYLPGEEYSIDVLSDFDATPLVAVPRIRVATKEGISVTGKVTAEAEAQRISLELARFLRLKGPSCIQMRRDRDGRLKLLEVNPRLGGGTIFAAFAGVNLALLTLRLVAGERVQIPAFRELTVLRYYEEVVLDGEAGR